MADQYIQLDFQGLSLQFLRVFLNTDLPRNQHEDIELDRSVYGTFFVKRRIYEEYYRWNFSTLIDRDKRPILDAIFFKHNELIRTRTGSPNILLTDCTAPFTELSPRTRGKAPAPFDSVTTVGTSPLFVSYFAQFYVYFTRQPTYTIQDQTLKVDLEFIEVNQKVTP